jgi:hypothetical protein
MRQTLIILTERPAKRSPAFHLPNLEQQSRLLFHPLSRPSSPVDVQVWFITVLPLLSFHRSKVILHNHQVTAGGPQGRMDMLCLWYLFSRLRSLLTDHLSHFKMNRLLAVMHPHYQDLMFLQPPLQHQNATPNRPIHTGILGLRRVLPWDPPIGRISKVIRGNHTMKTSNLGILRQLFQVHPRLLVVHDSKTQVAAEVFGLCHPTQQDYLTVPALLPPLFPLCKILEPLLNKDPVANLSRPTMLLPGNWRIP